MAIRFAFHPTTILREIQSPTPDDFAAVCDTLAAMGWRGVEYSASTAQKTWPEPSTPTLPSPRCSRRPPWTRTAERFILDPLRDAICSCFSRILNPRPRWKNRAQAALVFRGS